MWLGKHWFVVDFDDQTNMLSLKICRPIGAACLKGLFPKEYEVKVKDVLVEIEISERET